MGLGYIGLPTAIIAAKHGVTVTGVDINQEVVDKTNAGHLHIIEPGLEDLLKEVVAAGQLHATTQPETSDAFFIVVPINCRRQTKAVFKCFIQISAIRRRPHIMYFIHDKKPVFLYFF